MTNLFSLVSELLKSDTRFLSLDGKLLKNTIRDSALNLDENLINLLLQNPKTKELFFKNIKEITIFDTNKFIQFLNNKEFLADSYTSFKNKIGLINNKQQFISDSNEVVLSWPYKDCILAGGQDKEDSKRDEIFYNELLALDQIDKLLDEKVLTNFKKFSYKSEKKSDEFFTRDENGIIKDNLIIKGNNLLALHSLKSNFAGELDLVYIDPPYNTGGNGDTFEYNNKFKHSSWLTFMKNRLEIAKKLLKNQGTLIVAIDENEQFYLGVLLNELFPEHETHCITIVHNPRGIQGTNFSYTHEYAFFVIPKGKKTILNKKIKESEIEWFKLRNWGSESERKDAKNCFYPIILENSEIVGFGDVCDENFHPKQTEKVGNQYYIYPIDKNGIERKWRYARQSVEEIKHLLKVKKTEGGYDIDIGKDFGQYKTVWIDNRYDSNEYGTKLVKELVPGCKFSFPKSLWNVYDCLYAIVGNNKSAKILDFFGGSGTTGHAVLELNKEDSGNRQFILVEQMDYINEVTCPRIQSVIKNNGIGEFIYMELKKSNENFVEKIMSAKNTNEIRNIYNQILETAFINYYVDIKSIDENIDEFDNLKLEDQKRFLIELLDKNMLYVNYADIDDEKYNISDEEKNINKAFYKK